MILDIVNRLGPSTWWVFGVILLCVEIFAPGSFFVWFGIAAILTGVVALLTVLTWQVQALIFVALAVVLALVGRRFYGRPGAPSEQPFLNDRAARLVGRDYVLGEPIVDGKGKIKIDDTNWRVTGPDLPSGAKVRIAGADGAVLKVVEA